MRRLLIFDIDGTLTQSVQADEDLFVAAVEYVTEHPVTNRDWTTYRYSTDSGLLLEIFEAHAGRPPRADEVEAVKRRFFAGLDRCFLSDPHACSPVPGAGALLDRLRADTHTAVALATGSWRGSAERKLRQAGLDVSGLFVATADEAMDRPDIVRMAIEATREATGGADFERTVYVGDGLWDAAAAQALGIGFIGVQADKHGTRLREAGISPIVQNYLDADGFFAVLT